MHEIENEENQSQHVNPWTSVWLHPRKTVQYVMECKTSSFVLFIVAISGVIHLLDQAVDNDLVESWNIAAILLVALIVGPIVGVVGLYIASGIYHMFSLMLGGMGTYEQTRTAYAVSEIIIVVGGIVWIPNLLILGRGNFISDYDFTMGQTAWLVISLIINFIVGIWSLVVVIATISEVHRFSAWKATLVVFLPIIILTVIVIFIVGLTAPALF
ncbi:Yip1 family protein [Sporosarcina sp. Marseille-Q4943]|uniref:Yip1 family protein n=1 Tax=Sporosarcina sp. Marseille-Q4943 TaxID=2942204 RepID=UPI00208DB495|nr:Yip1 family protein [Sporosarcina sp. Marseille-Q4943]